MFCENCGSSILNSDQYCTNCGVLIRNVPNKTSKNTTRSLKDYIEKVFDVEKNVYVLEQGTARMNSYMQGLGHPGHPQQPQIQKPESVFADLGDFIVICGIIGAIIGLIVAVSTSSHQYEGFFMNLILTFFSGFGWARIGIGFLIGAAIVLAILSLMAIKSRSDSNKENKQAAQRYENIVVQDRQRVSIELSKRNQVLQFFNATDNELANTRQTLAQVYDLNIIHPNYRNFVAVASFHQYFDTGRCTTLDGPNGAYNLYEAERRQNMIIGQLDTVIGQLEQIKNNQYMLYDAINESNRKIDKITQISEMALDYNRANAENSAIIANNTRITKNNMETLAAIETYKFLKE